MNFFSTIVQQEGKLHTLEKLMEIQLTNFEQHAQEIRQRHVETFSAFQAQLQQVQQPQFPNEFLSQALETLSQREVQARGELQENFFRLLHQHREEEEGRLKVVGGAATGRWLRQRRKPKISSMVGPRQRRSGRCLFAILERSHALAQPTVQPFGRNGE